MRLAALIPALVLCVVVTGRSVTAASADSAPAAPAAKDARAAKDGPAAPAPTAAPAAPATPASHVDSLAAEVRAAETAFARSMADRKLDAFASQIDEEAIFVGGRGPLRGKAAIVDAWRRFYEGAAAPFSWEPDVVQVLDSGTLALSSGPVKDPGGKQIGTFNSVWRRGPDGQWKIVFDKGCPPCNCPEKE